ncbi:hypothetical protein VKS41_002742 [Umbelopsis sp. WA50703]
MRSFSTVSLFAAAAFLGSQISNVAAASGKIVQVVDSKDFCFFLPPPGSSDMLISDNEGDAVSYCMGSTPKATDSNTFPDGFILSAHFVSTSDYVQVTGQIDPSKANLVASDEGGQYDVVSPQGASCAGYKYFVNLVEPAGDDYCIRCCNTETNCNRGISQDGCARVVPGDYSGPGVSSSGSSSSSSGSSSSSSSSSSSGATATGTGSSSSGSSSSGSGSSGSDGSSSSSSSSSSGSGSDGSSSSSGSGSSGSDGSSGSTGSDGSSADGSGSDGTSSGTDGSGAAASDAAASSAPAASSPLATLSSSAPSSVLLAASSASSGASSASSLPTESVSAQSVNGATSAAPATTMVLALGGLAAAFMQLV